VVKKKERKLRGMRWSPAAWIAIASVAVLGVFTVQGIWFYRSLDRPVPRPPIPELVRIEKGWPASRIAEELHRHGLVRSPARFLLAARSEGVLERLRAGTFLIPPGHSPRSLARYLAFAAQHAFQVRVPEGSTANQVIALIQEKNLPGAPSAHDLVYDATFIRSLGLDIPSLEGYLYPDTYEYTEDTTARDLISRMAEHFLTVAAELQLASSEIQLASQGLLPLSPQQVVVLASIIEREAGPMPDKMKVSRVFHNRLLAGMRLESCATVRRAVNEWRRPLKLVDLQVDSPYNTYKRTGLPEAPICNPGRESIEAALHPAEGDILFFVAKGDGTNYFTSTFEDHLKAKEEYLASP
jgi:UPF0755 protein